MFFRSSRVFALFPSGPFRLFSLRLFGRDGIRSWDQSILRERYPSERGNVNLMITAHSAGVPTLLRRNIPKDFRAAQITHLLVPQHRSGEGPMGGTAVGGGV